MRPDVRDEWKRLKFTGRPRVLVGWRDPKHRLGAFRLKLHENTTPVFAELCQPALSQIQNDKERKFQNFAALDDEEYFWFEHSKLPKHSQGTGNAYDGEGVTDDDTADLVHLIRTADALEDASREDLQNRKYRFYAVCWPLDETFVGFVSRVDPVATMKPGHKFFQFGDVVTAIHHPDLALRTGADLVVGIDGTAILNVYAFENLLGDVDVSSISVGHDLKLVEKRLVKKIPLSELAKSSLEEVALRNRTQAKRLQKLPERIDQISLSVPKLKRVLKERGINPSCIFNGSNKFSFGPDDVGVFLDAIEGRYFKDELGDEERRADRFSTR